MDDSIALQPDFRERASITSDVMGASVWNDQEGGEADSCRICRGEATPEEPLFYPCKCSGSIKFVHQECLMEWLSHSHKKHCELCKTPFRFTKLYSPNMPSKLPGHIFARHLVIYTVKNIGTWLRACLVAFVWLGALPWAMRHVWAFLFWLGDGSWFVAQSSSSAHSLTATASAGVEYISTSSTSIGLSFPTSSASAAKVVDALLSYPTNPSTTFGTWLYNAFSVAISGNTAAGNRSYIASVQSMTGPLCDPATLLSEVDFFKNLTRSPRINRMIITTIEGQIITIIVVVCFILIFLIREWVVQQQPGINMGAGFNAEFPVPNRQQRLAEAAAAFEGLGDGVHVDDLANLDQERPIARPRRRVNRAARQDRFNRAENEGLANFGTDGREGETRDPDPVPTDRDDGTDANRRPMMPTRDALSGAAEIQRRLTENATENPESMDAAEFVSIWRRANGSPEEVIRIIEAEGLGERLSYWKTAMRNLENPGSRVAQDLTGSAQNRTAGGPTSRQEISRDDYSIRGVEEHKHITNSSDASESHLPSSSLSAGSTSVEKGKHRAVEDDETQRGLGRSVPVPDDRSMRDFGVAGPVWAGRKILDEQTSPGRPRAASDGPAVRHGISPLANNNWSFSALPEASDEQPVTNTVSEAPAPFLSGGTQSDLPFLASNSTSSEVVETTGNGDDKQSRRESNDNPQSFSDHPSSSDRIPARILEDDPQNLQDLVLDDNDREDAAFPHVDNSNSPLQPDALLPENDTLTVERDPEIVRARVEPQGFFGHVADWLWGDMQVPTDNTARDDEHIVENINDEAPFMPVQPRQPVLMQDEDNDDDIDQDPEVLEAARAAGIDPNDPDGLDDVEDLEGIMELVGMRGSLAGLLQNAIFSAVLISLTLACGVWVPYNVGRLFLLLVANPIATIKLPLRLLFSLAAVLQDLTIVAAGCAAWAGLQLMFLPRYLLTFFSLGFGSHDLGSTKLATGAAGPASQSLKVAAAAVERILNGIFGVILHLPESEVPAFSAVSHEALLHIKHVFSVAFGLIGSIVTSIVTPPPGGFIQYSTFTAIRTFLVDIGSQVLHFVAGVPSLLAKSDSWVISLNVPERVVAIDPTLSCWGGTDRFWAILAGYVAFCFIGAAYIRKGSPFSSSQTGMEWEATVIDILHQAGGVMKVILIISIEMLVFPLYCGMLLDLALLPLFDRATISSRLIFTIHTPLTSIFVHWFVGTCYMFHFALFVSMCRKIMRTGVLYFIRDPDDPTFHPVRDVLERNVATQLRKITFSAMVYGALVMVCLGGVVWSLACAFEGVLPIHWSSNEPVLQFPIDLLFYNFLMPLAVKFFQPSDGLHAMYKWWFQRCARMLRLTWFLFDQRRFDEEGQRVYKSWRDVIKGVDTQIGDPTDTSHVIDNQTTTHNVGTARDSETTANIVEFVRDGRYVRAPGSDQVRLPKGTRAFLEVTPENQRVDGLVDEDEGLHGRQSELFKMVYVPPYFRTRISIFIILIWLFAAVTGVGITIVPLVFGRFIFARLIPEHVQKNDVYAFSIGIYILGSALYAVLNVKKWIVHAQAGIAQFDTDTPRRVLEQTKFFAYRFISLLYIYSAVVLLLPILYSLVVEFYFIIPLHSYFNTVSPRLPAEHTIHFVQSWTLGLLYVKLTTRLIAWYTDSRPAEALRAATRQGWLNPDIRIATRCFIFPAVVISMTSLLLPISLANLAIRYEIFGVVTTIERQALIYRYAYPFAASLAAYIWGLGKGWEMLKGWRMRIRDEVYLIGERLHNFGDMGRSKSGAGAALVGRGRIET